MPILTNWKITISVDDILRAQGANPNILRERSPHLITVAENALKDAGELLHPFVMYEISDVIQRENERLFLANGHQISGKIVNKQLACANRILIAACTISDDLEKKVSAEFHKDPSYALALDAAGIAAVDKLSSLAQKYFKQNLIPPDLKATSAFNPGMKDWPVAVGQEQIFSILKKISDRIRLSDSFLMIPAKSVSFVIGIGNEVNTTTKQCDYCDKKQTCYLSKAGKELIS